MKLDHIGYATKDIVTMAAMLAKTAGYKIIEEELVASQGVKVAFLEPSGGGKAGEPLIELLEPVDPISATARFIAKRGEGFHHLCYEVPDLVAACSRLAASGVRFIYDAPRPGSRETFVNFTHPLSTGGIMFEYCQKKQGHS